MACLLSVLPVVLALPLVGCGNTDSSSATQAVAKVSDQEITELQVNQILERQSGIKPEQVDAARRKALASLVDQQILVRKAQELKLDRDQRVVQAIEAAKREIVARAYLERIAEGVSKPTPEAVRKYYQDKPSLFGERRVYTFQDLNVDATAEQRVEIEAQMKLLKSAVELEAYFKSKQIPVRVERSTVPAENVPLPLLDRLATMKLGQGLIVPTTTGLHVMLIAGIQDAPVTEEKARPAIETFLLNEQKRQAVEKEMSALRAATKVEYLGKFADMSASAAAASASAASGTGDSSARGATVAVSAASAALTTRAPASSASGSGGMDAATLKNAMSGLK